MKQRKGSKEWGEIKLFLFSASLFGGVHEFKDVEGSKEKECSVKKSVREWEILEEKFKVKHTVSHIHTLCRFKNEQVN